MTTALEYLQRRAALLNTPGVSAPGNARPLPANDGRFLADTALMLPMGAADIYEGIGGLTTIFNPEAGISIMEQAQRFKEWIEPRLSEEAKQKLEKEFATLGPDAAYRDLEAIWLNLVRQIPNFAAIVAGSLAGGAAAGALGAGARGAAIAKGLGAAGAGGIIGGGQGAADAISQVDEDDPKVRQRISEGVPPEQALNEARSEAALYAAIPSAVVGAVIGPYQARLLERALGRKLAGRTIGQRIGGAIATGVGGALSEGVEEGGQQALSELGALQAAGDPFNPKAVAEGAVAGAFIGGGATGAANIAGRAGRVTGSLYRKMTQPPASPGQAGPAAPPTTPASPAGPAVPPTGPAQASSAIQAAMAASQGQAGPASPVVPPAPPATPAAPLQVNPAIQAAVSASPVAPTPANVATAARTGTSGASVAPVTQSQISAGALQSALDPVLLAQQANAEAAAELDAAKMASPSKTQPTLDPGAAAAIRASMGLEPEAATETKPASETPSAGPVPPPGMVRVRYLNNSSNRPGGGFAIIPEGEVDARLQAAVDAATQVGGSGTIVRLQGQPPAVVFTPGRGVDENVFERAWRSVLTPESVAKQDAIAQAQNAELQAQAAQQPPVEPMGAIQQARLALPPPAPATPTEAAQPAPVAPAEASVPAPSAAPQPAGVAEPSAKPARAPRVPKKGAKAAREAQPVEPVQEAPPSPAPQQAAQVPFPPAPEPTSVEPAAPAPAQPEAAVPEEPSPKRRRPSAEAPAKRVRAAKAAKAALVDTDAGKAAVEAEPVQTPEPDTKEPSPADVGPETVARIDESAEVVQRKDGSTEVIDSFAPDTSEGPRATANTVLASALQDGKPRRAADVLSEVIEALPKNDPLAATLNALRTRAGNAMIQAVNREKGPAAVYLPKSDLIELDLGKINPTDRVQVLAHEMAHAALHGSIATNEKLRSEIEKVRNVVADVFESDPVLKDSDIAKYVRESDAQEFGTLLVTSDVVSQAAHSHAPKGLMQRVLRLFASLVKLKSWNAAEQVLRPLEWSAPNDTERQALLRIALMQGDSAPQTWTALAALLQAASSNPNSPSARMAATLQPKLTRAGLGAKDRSRRIAIDALTVENIVDWFKGRFGPSGDQALQLYARAVSDMAHRANSLIKDLQAYAATLDDMSVLQPELAKDVSLLMHDATLYALHPDLPLTAPENAQGRERPGAALRHADLQARWNAMPQEGKDIYIRMRNSLRDMTLFHAATLVASAIRSDVAKAFGLNPTDPATVNFARTLALQYIDPNNKPAMPVGLSPAAAKVLDSARDQMTTLMGTDRGPYFPLMRSGRFFVIAGDPEYTSMLMTQSEWDNNTDEYLNIDPKSKPKWVGNDVFFKGRRYAVFSVDSEAEARALVDSLKNQFGGQVHYRLRDQYMESVKLDMPKEMHKIIEAATRGLGSQAAKTVEQNLIEMLASRLESGSYIHARMLRASVAGASRNMGNAYLRASVMMARDIARIEYSPRVDEAVNLMRDVEKIIATGNPSEAVVLSEIRQSLVSRSELTDVLLNPHLGGRFLTRIANFTATAFLTAPATVITNLTQPWVVTFPVLAGKFGAAKAGQMLADASRDVVSGAVKALDVAYRRAAKGLAVLPPGRAWHDYLLANNMSRAEQLMIDELVRRNRLDFTMADDLIEMTDPQRGPFAPEPSKVGEGWRKVQDFLFIAPRVSETFNRAATALAAYRLAVQSGMPHASAVDAADDAIRLTHFNYETYNKSKFFITPYLRPLLVFKQYAYGMLFLQGYLLRQAIKGNTPRARAEAAKALGIMYAVLFAASGLLNSIPEPIWIALNLVAKLFGFSAEEILRAGTVALAGEEAAPYVLHGPIANLLNIDLQRMAINDMFIPDEVYKADTANDWLKAALQVYFGAPGGIITNAVDGMTLLGNGQYLRGIARMFPVRVVANPIQAIDYLANGYTDRMGRPIMSSDELSAWAVGIKAIGFTPLTLSERNAFSEKVVRESKRASLERARIYRDFTAAIASKKPTAPIIERIENYNRKFPTTPITAQSLRRSVIEQMRARANLRLYGTPVSNTTAKTIARNLAPLYKLPSNINPPPPIE